MTCQTVRPVAALALIAIFAAAPAGAQDMGDALSDMMAPSQPFDPLAGPGSDLADIASQTAGTRREIEGAGNRNLVLEGPFEMTWRSYGSYFALKIETRDAPRPEPGPVPTVGGQTVVDLMRTVQSTRLEARATGRADGRLRVVAPGPHSVDIEAIGLWKLEVRGG